MFLQQLQILVKKLQILNSYKNRTYSNSQAGAIYNQSPPLVNVTCQSIEWNAYDIIFHAHRFDSDRKMTKKGTMTAFHNGVLIQDHVEIEGTTEYIGPLKVIPHGDGSLVIQDHDNYVRYKNIWLRRL